MNMDQSLTKGKGDVMSTTKPPFMERIASNLLADEEKFLEKLGVFVRAVSKTTKLSTLWVAALTSALIPLVIFVLLGVLLVKDFFPQPVFQFIGTSLIFSFGFLAVFIIMVLMIRFLSFEDQLLKNTCRIPNRNKSTVLITWCRLLLSLPIVFIVVVRPGAEPVGLVLLYIPICLYMLCVDPLKRTYKPKPVPDLSDLD